MIRALRLVAWRWLRDRAGDVAMALALRVEQLERPDRDRRGGA